MATRTASRPPAAVAGTTRVEPRGPLQNLVEALPGVHVLATADPDHLVVAASEGCCRALMVRREDVVGRGLLDLFPDDPETADESASLRASIRRVVASRAPERLPVRCYAIRVPGDARQERWWRPIGTPVPGANGDVAYVLHTLEDVTALRQALEFLRSEVQEHEQAEAQLRQAQKLEVVGQFAGGIAHDFNNMLQVISGSLEMVQHELDAGHATEAGEYMDEARRTVRRGAALAGRLLAFARRRDAPEPRAVVPGALVEGMAELIRGAVGSAVNVELLCDSGSDGGDGAWAVLCDPGQLENALLNLAVNARDAMPKARGGSLTISTRQIVLGEADMAGQDGAARPGDYVEIAVADTGSGMDEATKARAFEPFFTTKPVEQGTGLGLSQLHGFVRQARGVVRLDSAPGEGTTVRLYLPRHGHEARRGVAACSGGTRRTDGSCLDGAQPATGAA